MASIAPEIALVWNPKHPQSDVFFDVPIGEERTAKLEVYPRIGTDIRVRFEEPREPWIKIEYAKPQPRGHEPDSRFEYLEIDSRISRGKIPPFEVLVIVNTSGLEAGYQYDCFISFSVEETVIWKEPVVVTTEMPTVKDS